MMVWHTSSRPTKWKTTGKLRTIQTTNTIAHAATTSILFRILWQVSLSTLPFLRPAFVPSGIAASPLIHPSPFSKSIANCNYSNTTHCPILNSLAWERGKAYSTGNWMWDKTIQKTFSCSYRLNMWPLCVFVHAANKDYRETVYV